jgi:cytochrome b
LLAVLVVAGYASGELGLIHAWLGYAIAGVLVVRLLWAASGAPQLGLARFYPQFAGLKLGNVLTHPAVSRTLLLCIASCLVGVTVTGIALDRGRAVRIAVDSVVADASAEGQKNREGTLEKGGAHEDGEGPLSEAHEMLQSSCRRGCPAHPLSSDLQVAAGTLHDLSR